MNINYLNSNIMKTSKLFIAALFCLTLITSCSDDDNPTPVLEEELITNVSLTFVNDADANDVVVLANIAPDGQEGASNNTINGSFTSGATYSLTLSLLNAEDADDVEDVLNDDIIPEADEHFFVYAVNGINLTVTRDSDDIEGPNGSNLGVNTTWVAGAASTGNVQIRLVHEPESVDDSDEFGSSTGGSEDINITFQGVEIQ
jgi:hypothetical protein